MRKVLAIGTLALSGALGAGAAYASNPNVPSWSPYSLMQVSEPAPSSTFASPSFGMTERRAAYVDTRPNTNVPSWSAYSIVPQGQ
jgi:hypothetical protein